VGGWTASPEDEEEEEEEEEDRQRQRRPLERAREALLLLLPLRDSAIRNGLDRLPVVAEIRVRHGCPHVTGHRVIAGTVALAAVPDARSKQGRVPGAAKGHKGVPQ